MQIQGLDFGFSSYDDLGFSVIIIVHMKKYVDSYAILVYWILFFIHVQIQGLDFGFNSYEDLGCRVLVIINMKNIGIKNLV